MAPCSLRRLCPRSLRATPVDVIILSLGLFVAVMLVSRQYSKTIAMTSSAADDDDNSLREIVIGPEVNGAVQVNAPSDKKRHQLPVNRNNAKASIDRRLTAIGDFRSDECVNTHYDVAWATGKVSLIIDFTDYEFYDTRNAIDSCLRLHSDDYQLVTEIVAIDDGSTLDYIVKDSRRYFRSLEKVTLLRHDPSSGTANGEQLGTAYARLAAIRQAKGDVFVFLSSSVVCTAGWLEPLIDTLGRYPDSIVTPHHDKIHDPISLQYELTDDWLVGHASWDLAIRMKAIPPNMTDDQRIAMLNAKDAKDDESTTGTPRPERPEFPPPPRLIPSAAVRGTIFAVSRAYFAEIGSYDPKLAADVSDAGEHLELSVRTWLCGGAIYTDTCSRVGVLNLHDPVKVAARMSADYISSVWFTSHKSAVMRTFSRQRTVADAVAADGTVYYDQNGDVVVPTARRRRQTPRRLIPRCDVTATQEKRDIDWYLRNVASDLVVPSNDAVQFGLLRVKTNRCARLLSKTSRIALLNCKSTLFGRPPDEMIFELTQRGYIKVKGKCLTVQNNAYILAKNCVDGDTHQLWNHKKTTDELQNVWSHYCATHVTDPDTEAPGDRQIAMAQECAVESPDSEPFKQWQFIAV